MGDARIASGPRSRGKMSARASWPADLSVVRPTFYSHLPGAKRTIVSKVDLKTQLADLGERARRAARELARLSSAQKNAALLAMADEVVTQRETILAANEQDLSN